MNLFFGLSYLFLGLMIASMIHFNIEKVLDDQDEVNQYKSNKVVMFSFLTLVIPVALVCLLIVNIIDFIKSSFGGKK